MEQDRIIQHSAQRRERERNVFTAGLEVVSISLHQMVRNVGG